MRNRNKKGFTLIELLIVIAIIGILAAVLIPNLLAARAAGQDRAAQAHSQQVFTAINAVIAEDTNSILGAHATLNPVQVSVGGGALADMASTFNCAPANAVEYTSYGAGAYEVNEPGAAVLVCQVLFTAGQTDLRVVVKSRNHLLPDNQRCYINGRAITDVANADCVAVVP